MRHVRLTGLLASVLSTIVCWAQPDGPAEEPPDFDWQQQSMARLDDVAQIDLGSEYVFLDGDETRRLMNLYGNPPTDIEIGMIASKDNPYGWFIVFEFDEIGFVKDDDENEIDADAILESFREGTKESNKTRASMGMPELNLIGWRVEPNYEASSQNLEWCMEFESDGEPVLNHNIRLLGRRGVTNVTLVCDSSEFDHALSETRHVLDRFSYIEGQRYSDFTSGDKIAKYGLAALVTGGAVAVAAKSGLLAKLLKPLLFGLIAVGGAVASFFKRLFGAKTEEEQVDDLRS